MAVSNFKNIVPSGNDAVFPFQMSAASLSTTATVYQLAGTDGAKSTVASGVSVVDDGAGLYRLKVTSGSMSGGNMYYATVVAGSEQVRIPMWSYAPTGHTDDILSRLGGSAAAMSFSGILSGATNLEAGLQKLAGEMGDVSAAGITGSPVSVAAALKVLFDEVDGVEEAIGDENDADSAATLFGRIKKNLAVATVIKDNTGDLKDALGPLNQAASADFGTDKTLMGMIRLMGASQITIDGIVDELTTQGDTNEAKLDVIDGIVDSILADTAVIGAPAGVSVSADIAALKAETALIVADTAELQGDWANGGRLDLIVDELTAQGDANETKLDTAISAVGVVDGIVDAILVDTAAMQPQIADIQTVTNDLKDGGRLDLLIDELTAQGDTNEGKLDTIDTVVDGIQTDLSNGTDGLGALKALIDAVNTDLSNGTDGLGALKALIDTVDSVADATKVVVDAQESKAQADTRQTALIAEHDASQATLATMETKAQADTRQTALVAENDATQATLGSPAGSSMSADIAAVKAVADTLSLQVNAVLQPMVPSERYSGAAAKRISLVIQTIDGATGASDDMDQAGTPAGQMYIKVLDGAGNSVTDLHDAASGGSGLASADATIYSAAVDGYKIMNRVSTGFYQAFLEIAAYKVESYDILFYAQDSDPQAAQEFRAMRQMEVRSPVQAQFAGGAF